MWDSLIVIVFVMLVIGALGLIGRLIWDGYQVSHHRVQNFTKIDFGYYDTFKIHSTDPKSKEYSVTVVSFNTWESPRIFLDRVGTENEVIWKHTYFGDDYDIEIHVSNTESLNGLDLIRGKRNK
jgi:hypothetical protein